MPIRPLAASPSAKDVASLPRRSRPYRDLGPTAAAARRTWHRRSIAMRLASQPVLSPPLYVAVAAARGRARWRCAAHSASDYSAPKVAKIARFARAALSLIRRHVAFVYDATPYIAMRRYVVSCTTSRRMAGFRRAGRPPSKPAGRTTR